MTKIICKECGREIVGVNFIILNADEVVCYDCASKYYTKCNNCNKLFRKNGASTICDKCSNEMYTNSCNNYSYKPTPYFKNKDSKLDGKDLGCRYYGLEMEYSYIDGDTIQSLIPDMYREKYIYNKRDGSLHSGTEVVSSPLSKYSIPRMLEGMKALFNELENRPHYSESAGLHIHVNRKSIQPMTVYKLSILLNTTYTNKCKHFIYYLTNRCGLENQGYTNSYCSNGRYNSILSENHRDRHIAFNNRNKNTVEFRMFKSTNKPDEIKAYIEIVDTMIDFCDTRGIKDINVYNYIEYLKSIHTSLYICGKIATYETRYGKVDNVSCLFNVKKIYDKLKGIPYYKYIDIAYQIGDRGDRYISDLTFGSCYFGFKTSNIDCHIPCTSSVRKKILSTYKKVMLHKIKELVKCA